jgi:hypothetical protein
VEDLRVKLAFLFGLATLSGGCGDGAMSEPEEPPTATAPALPEAEALSGRWRVTREGSSCEIGLSATNTSGLEADPGAPLLTARAAGPCPGLEAVAGWRPIPLGFDLTDADGRTLTVFEQIGPDRFRSIDQVWTMSRD